MEAKTVYFEDISISHTEEVFNLVKQRASALGIKNIMVASTRGDTGVKAAGFFKGFSLVVVGLAAGIWEPNVSLFPAEKIKTIEKAGGKVILAAPAFSGVGSGTREQPHIQQTGDIIADTLRIFGQGMKVTCEIVLEAVDAGYIRSNEPVISIAGTGKVRGADTAIVVTPVNSNRFFELKVHEIICKPRL
jgi:uncharacterized protein